MIIGRPGSGKSTFSIMLQKSLNIPLFHLDKYFFIADWVPREYEDFLSLQKELVAKPCWIIDGNSSKSFEIRYQDLLSYMWNYEQRINPLLNVLKNQYPKVKFIELRSSYDVAHLMRVLKHKEEYSIVTGF